MRKGAKTGKFWNFETEIVMGVKLWVVGGFFMGRASVSAIEQQEDVVFSKFSPPPCKLRLQPYLTPPTSILLSPLPPPQFPPPFPPPTQPLKQPRHQNPTSQPLQLPINTRTPIPTRSTPHPLNPSHFFPQTRRHKTYGS